MELGNISQPEYSSSLEEPGSSTPLLVGMAHGFLRLLQPNALPLGPSEPSEILLLRCLLLFPSQLLWYELGFLVCMAIGLLFIILVPLVGCCFCLCRC
ncbi:PRM1A protein, partial [Upupa epops]|nr:PRM1A protein [Upupa epops]